MTTSKRVLTDETRQSLIASNSSPHSTPDDIASRLRSVGSRVRKNVLEGYISSPPSFQKANSTGAIFCSARDTLNEVYRSSFSNTASSVPSRKRSRSQEDKAYDSDGALDEDNIIDRGSTDVNSDEDPVTIIMGPDARTHNRPMRALRKPRRSMLSTRSLPTGALTFAHDEPTSDITMNTVSEEDWSVSSFTVQNAPLPQDHISSFDSIFLP